MAVTVFSPAKINLFLAVNPRRPDGFHNLVSVAAPLDFGDELTATSGTFSGGQFGFECDNPEVPSDDSNLVLKAARAFAAETGWRQQVVFRLIKRIPVGAGLGGGSGNAVATLRALNEISGGILPEERLGKIAMTLGSDCALFLHRAPVIMRGRGEQVEALPPGALNRLRERRVLVFKPGFGISTAWAYGRMAAVAPRDYLSVERAEEKLALWLCSRDPAEALLSNNMEGVAFEKFIALPVLLEKLRDELAVTVGMSGSGSACFALLPENNPANEAGLRDVEGIVTRMRQMIAEAWGEGAFVQETRIS